MGMEKFVPLTLPFLTLNIDNQKNIWVSNMYGIYCFDTESMVFSDSIFTSETSIYNRTGVVQGNYNEELILLSCPPGGGGFLNSGTKQFTRWKLDDGMMHKTISAIKSDDAGNIWFTSGFNLYHFNPADSTRTKSYKIPERSVRSAFVPSQLIQLQNGKWCALTRTEIIVFDPKELLASTRSDKTVFITGMKVFDEQMKFEPFFEDDEKLVLSYKQNFIKVEFTSLQYSLLEDVRYSYKLTGVDKNWVSADEHLSASYTNLKPGKSSLPFSSTEELMTVIVRL